MASSVAVQRRSPSEKWFERLWGFVRSDRWHSHLQWSWETASGFCSGDIVVLLLIDANLASVPLPLPLLVSFPSSQIFDKSLYCVISQKSGHRSADHGLICAPLCVACPCNVLSPFPKNCPGIPSFIFAAVGRSFVFVAVSRCFRKRTAREENLLSQSFKCAVERSLLHLPITGRHFHFCHIVAFFNTKIFLYL